MAYKLTDNNKENELEYLRQAELPQQDTQPQQQNTQPQQTQTSQEAQAQPQQTVKPIPQVYDPKTDAAYTQAMAALEQAKSQLPNYQGTYDGQILNIYNQIMGRDPFSYNVNEDALYQQYRDQYVQNGQLAMMDTMGQLQQMTGGYGNSYAQTAGQNTYQAYLQQLNDKVPELYRMAYDRYQQEGDDLYAQYSLAGDMADTEYGRYQDQMSQYWQNVNYQQGQADQAYAQGKDQWQMQQDAAAQQYQQLLTMYEMGYQPTYEDWLKAGLTPEQAQVYANYFGGLGGAGGDDSGRWYVDESSTWFTNNLTSGGWINTTDGQNWINSREGQNWALGNAGMDWMYQLATSGDNAMDEDDWNETRAKLESGTLTVNQFLNYLEDQGQF